MSDHGISRYTNDGCRCSICREAHRLNIAKRRAARRAWVAVNGLPTEIRHGASAYTNWGCRCGVCRQASTEDKRRYSTGGAA